jgi:hypothetical protein
VRIYVLRLNTHDEAMLGQHAMILGVIDELSGVQRCADGAGSCGPVNDMQADAAWRDN